MPRIFAVSMMRDEEDVVFEVLQHLFLQGVQGFIIANHLSTDRTAERLEEANRWCKQRNPCCLFEVIEDCDPGYYQYMRMTVLARMAAQQGAEIVIPFDADEIWFARGMTLAEYFERAPADAMVFRAKLYDYYPSSLDGSSGIPFVDIQHRNRGVSDVKIAFRAREDVVIDQGNHQVVYEKGFDPTAVCEDLLEIAHFPNRTFQQFLRKVRNGWQALQASTLPEQLGSHWREFGRILDAEGEDGLRRLYEERFYLREPREGFSREPALSREYLRR